MDILSLLIGLIGITPLIYLSYNYVQNYYPTRRFLAFNGASSLDVIITTSSVSSSPKGAKVQRATTGIGQVQGVAHVAKFIGKYYKNKTIKVHFSRGLQIRPVGDLVLLGGPSKNDYSKRFLEKVVLDRPGLNLEVDDENAKIIIKDKVYDSSVLNVQKGLPAKDVCLLICCANPFSPNTPPGRAVYCAGLTSYGTSAAALWLFNDILTAKGGFERLRKGVGIKSPSFLAVLSVDIVNGGIAAVELLDVYKL